MEKSNNFVLPVKDGSFRQNFSKNIGMFFVTSFLITRNLGFAFFVLEYFFGS